MLSCEELNLISTWRQLNPGWTHRLYDAEEREAFVSSHYPEVLELYLALGACKRENLL
jgi:mannosyltransferase OCH1-like enzyme